MLSNFFFFYIFCGLLLQHLAVSNAMNLKSTTRIVKRFSFITKYSNNNNNIITESLSAINNNNNNNNNRIKKTASILAIVFGSLYSNPTITTAVEKSPQQVLIYKTGKNPIIIDPKDPKVGSKKDINFLRLLLL